MKILHFLLNLVCILVLALGGNRLPAAAQAKDLPTAPRQAAGGNIPAGLNAAEWADIRSQIAAAEYQVTWQRRDGRYAYRAPNRAQGFEASFDAQGLSARGGPAAWNFGLALQAYNSQPVAPASLNADKERVTAQRGPALSEWYRNTPQGVEHGLALDAPPDGSGLASLDFAISGDLRAQSAGNGIALLDARGATVLLYDSLAVYDAAGQALPASLALIPGGLRIRIDARGAAYPLTVDPLLHSQTKILHASDAQANDRFGNFAAIDGNILVVSADWEGGGAGDPTLGSGAAYVFQRNQGGADTWGEVKILRASDAQAWDYFGRSAAIDGDTIVIGAYAEDGGAGDPAIESGAAYVFQRNQGGADAWGEVKILRASEARARDSFGVSAAIDGDTIVIGAVLEDGGAGDPNLDSGAAYVFQRNQGGADAWGEVKILRASEAQARDSFGVSAAINGDTIIIGAILEDGGAGNPALDSGAAYVFQRNQDGPDAWGEVKILRASDAQADDRFGNVTAISGDTIVIGAHGEDGGAGDPTIESGAAYVFQRNQGGADTWGEVKILRASDAQAGDMFGTSAAIDGDTIVIGALHEGGGAGDPAIDSGAAYVFQRNQGGAEAWGEVKILRASDAQAWDNFGASAAIDGDTIVIGAGMEDGGAGDPALDSGAAYVFSASGDWQPTRAGLHTSEAQAEDKFGQSAAIDGNILVVSAEWEDGGPGDPALGSGAAYVFQRNRDGANAWGLVKTLRASDAQANDWFGNVTAISGDTIVIGAFREDGGVGDTLPDSGAAYIFRRNEDGADAWGEVKILRASDAQADDNFGNAVSISGDTIVIGAGTEDGGPGVPAPDSGAAYVFSRNRGGAEAWGEVKILHASDAQANDRFGNFAAISGDTVVISAVSEDGGAGDPTPDSGAAYVFQRNQDGPDAWGQVKILHASDAQAGDNFGWSAAIDGDTIVIGAGMEDGGAGDPLSNSSAAYVFQRNQGPGGVPTAEAWGEVKILRASDAQASDQFGQWVAISGDTIVIGARYEDGGPGDPVADSGAAYIFKRNLNAGGVLTAEAWGQVKVLHAADAQASDQFGFSVAISSGIVVVGAPYEDDGAGDPISGAGAAYIFTLQEGWEASAVPPPPASQTGDQFGSVALDGDILVVGAPYEDGGPGDPTSDSGAAYVFYRASGELNAWSQAAVLRASDAQPGDRFGSSVSVYSGTIVIGAPYEDGGPGDPTSDSGAAYVFQRNQGGPNAWGQEGDLHPGDPQSGDLFGYALSLDGDTLAVGAPYEDGGPGNPTPDSGAVYLFAKQASQRSPAPTSPHAWGQEGDLHPGDPQSGDLFGYALSLDGDTLAVGAPYEDGGPGGPAPDCGAAYVFRRDQGGPNAWGQEGDLHPGDPQAGDLFGYALSLDGDTLAIGAPYEDGGPGNPILDSGAVYLFANQASQRSPVPTSPHAWGQEGDLHPGIAQADASGSAFGASLVIDNATLVVSAPFSDGDPTSPITNTGVAYVYTLPTAARTSASAWVFSQALSSQHPQPGGHFGHLAALDGAVIAVGAPLEDGSPSNPITDTGSAYVFALVQPPTPPLAQNDSFLTPANSSSNVLNVLANDSDPNLYTLQVSVVSTPTFGVAVNNSANILYTPPAGATCLLDTFAYTVTNGNGGYATAQVSVRIGPAACTFLPVLMKR